MLNFFLKIFVKRKIRVPFDPWYKKLLVAYYAESNPPLFLEWAKLKFNCEIDLEIRHSHSPTFDLLFESIEDVVIFKLLVAI